MSSLLSGGLARAPCSRRGAALRAARPAPAALGGAAGRLHARAPCAVQHVALRDRGSLVTRAVAADPAENADMDAEAAKLASENLRSLLLDFKEEDVDLEVGIAAGVDVDDEVQLDPFQVGPTVEVPDHCLPKVAVVGRPNVGKSALFNRLTGSLSAIVYDKPGVTRDRLYTRAMWTRSGAPKATEFMLVDTGGLLDPGHTEDSGSSSKISKEVAQMEAKDAAKAGIPAMIERQAVAAIDEADVIILTCDGKAGVTGADEEIVKWVRRNYSKTKKILLAINKCESPTQGPTQASEFWSLGLGEPLAVSGLHGTGTSDLLDQVCDSLPPPDMEAQGLIGGELSIAIVGRPNVGKSSLLNAICGEERSIVSAMSGTTMDAIDTKVQMEDGQVYKLIDTAGIRKRAKVGNNKDGAEELSVKRALRAIRRSDVTVLVLDAVMGATEQDFRLAVRAEQEGKAVVIVVNKWDMVPDKDTGTMNEYTKNLLVKLRCVDWATTVFTSATTGQRVQKVMDAAIAAGEQHRKRVSTATLNLVLSDAIRWKAPPSSKGGKRGRIYYTTCPTVSPPTFVLFVNDPKCFTESYRRYLERTLRENIGFPGTPIRLLFRGKTVIQKPGSLNVKQGYSPRDLSSKTAPWIARDESGNYKKKAMNREGGGDDEGEGEDDE